MAKSAQQKFNEYLAECDATRDAVKQFEQAVHAKYDGSGYAYLAGYFMMQMQEAISELPKAKRQEFRDKFLREAKRFEQENLVRVLSKEAV